jgi:hypothetical protein
MIFPCPKPQRQPKQLPKPRRRPKRQPPGLRRGRLSSRTRVKARNARRKGSAFPHRRDVQYRAFIRGLDCLLAGRRTTVQISPFDRHWWGGEWLHVCFGRIECAHVNETQAPHLL